MTDRRLRNVNIQINENVIARARDLQLSMDYLGSILFILFAIYEQRFDLLDHYDDSNKERRVFFLYTYLVRKGLLDISASEEEYHYNITDRGIEFVDFVHSEFERVTDVQTFSESLESKVAEETIEDWIMDWIHIFPEGAHGGRYLRNSKKECLDKMKWFIATYEFSKDLIMKATRDYINSQANSSDGHTYTRNASYFISKHMGRGKSDRISDLATWCERVSNTSENDQIDYSAYDKIV